MESKWQVFGMKEKLDKRARSFGFPERKPEKILLSLIIGADGKNLSFLLRKSRILSPMLLLSPSASKAFEQIFSC